MTPATASNRWQAVLDRDTNADGVFVYAVRSTGIYCRPSCPSRRPAPRHVVFFPGPVTAEQAGFRACARCRPRGVSVSERHAEIVERACRVIGDAVGPVALRSLAAGTGLSPHHLQRTFKRLLGISPREYAAARRAGKLRTLLRSGNGVSHAQFAAGYGSSSRLYERADSLLGMTPAAYRRGGKGLLIRFASTDTPLGTLLVAATDRGLCAAHLGASVDKLQRALRDEFPEADITRDDDALGDWLHAIVRGSALARETARPGKRGLLELSRVPLDIRATVFQARVWKALRAIPAGETRSYTEIARVVGRPRAVRAVARACATNPVAVVIPCHRVVREDGELGGYRWGLDRKRALLDREAGHARAHVTR